MALRARVAWHGHRGGRDVDVLLAHAPPRGVGDDDDPPHRGFTALHGLVNALRPTVLLHGHVHPGCTQAGPTVLRTTLVRNVTGWHLLEVRPRAGMTTIAAGAGPRPEDGADAS